MLCWSDFVNFVMVRSHHHRYHYLPYKVNSDIDYLRADRWLINNVYRLLIKGLTRLHDEKRIKDVFTGNNIKHQKNYLMGIP